MAAAPPCRVNRRGGVLRLQAVGDAQVPQVVLRQDHLVEAQPSALGNAAFRLVDGADLARQADLAHHGPAAADGPVSMGGRDGRAQRKVRGGLGQRHAARDVDVGIAVRQLISQPFFQHGHQQIHAAVVCSRRRPPGIAATSSASSASPTMVSTTP